MTLAWAAVLGYAVSCQCADPALCPNNQPIVSPQLIAQQAQTESNLNPAIIHLNPNGTRDFGLMQINETNFALLHLDAQTALDPCSSIHAAVVLWTILSRYNTGNPTKGIANGYVWKVLHAYRVDPSHASMVTPAPVITLESQALSYDKTQ